MVLYVDKNGRIIMKEKTRIIANRLADSIEELKYLVDNNLQIFTTNMIFNRQSEDFNDILNGLLEKINIEASDEINVEIKSLKRKFADV